MAGRLARSDSRESVFSNASCVSGVGEWQIGDRVRLDSKIGTLAYVGHTKFAPGEWIGLVLDTADGKNNGSVQGVTYFTCEDNHGIFCKSSKLERISHSPAVGSPMRELSNKYASEFGFDIGDRVMVSGGKIGYLRYLGLSDFAEGIWCGVELDSPLGKNDGTVQGKRYFACKPLHGLFAPAKKTEKAPKLDTPSKIRVHHNKTSMLRAHKSGGSDESLNSIGASSVSSRMTSGTRMGPVKRSVARSINASTNETLVKALQETIQEKDRHLEQMIHELDLERNEIAEVTARCEVMERRLANGEGGGSGAVDEEKIRRMEKLENERKSLKNTLIEKDKIIEDLQFRLEEEVIMRQEKESETKELGMKLAKISTVEAVNIFDSVSLEEKNAELAMIREDMEKIKVSRDKIEGEKDRNEKMIHDMRTTLEETEERMKKLEIDFEKVVNDLEEESRKNVSVVKELKEEKRKGEVLDSEIRSMEKERDESRREIEAIRTTMESMKTASCASCVELESGKKDLERKIDRMVNEMGDEEGKFVKEKEEFNKQLLTERNKMELKEKEMSILFQSMNETERMLREMEDKMNEEKNRTNALNVELTKMESNYSLLKYELNESELRNEKTKEDLEKMRDTLSESNNEVEMEKKNGDELKKCIEKLQKEVDDKVKEIKSLSDDVCNISTKSEGQGKENEDIKKNIDDLKKTIDNEKEEKRCLIETIQEKISSLNDMETTVESLKSFLENKKIEINRLSLESEERKKEVEELRIAKKNMDEYVEGITAERDDGKKLLKETEFKLAGIIEKNEEMKNKEAKKIEGIRSKLTTTEEILSVKETELKCALESLSAIHSSMEVAKMSDDERSRELNGVKEELVKERTIGDEMKRRNGKLTEEIDEMRHRLEEMENDMKKGVEKMEKEREELMSEMKKMDSQWKICKRREEKEIEEKDIVEEGKRKIEEELKRERLKIEEVQNEKDQLEKRLKEVDDEMNRVNEQLKREREEVGKKEIQTTEWSRRYEELEAQMKKSHDHIGQFEIREAEWEITIERLRVDLSEKEVESNENKNKVIELSSVVDVLSGKMDELNENSKKMECEIKNEREKKEAIEEERDRWKKEKEDRDERIENLLKEVEHLRISISVDNDKNDKLGEKVSNLVEEIMKGEETRKIMEKEKESLIKNTKKMEIELEELKITISTTSSSSEELIEKLKTAIQEKMRVEEMRQRDNNDRKEFEEKVNIELAKSKEEQEKVNSKNLEQQILLRNNDDLITKITIDNEREKKEWEDKVKRLTEELAKRDDSVKESTAKIRSMECEVSAEKKERSKLQAEMRLNVGDLQEKSEESFKKDTEIENLKYEKTQIMNELEKERKEKKEIEDKVNNMEDQKKRAGGQTIDTIDGIRGELNEERKKYDELLAQKKQTHELFDELERSWRKKEEILAEKVDGLNAELELVKKKSANEQIKELQNEVDLLRSIVAERVKKEEKYKKEIEILKNMPLDGTPMRKEKKEIAPRKFCDICDVFDTHDTEDCPTQSMEPIDPSPKKKVIPPSREYCDSCEVFGHDTSVCPNLFASEETPKKKKDYTF